MVGLDDSYDQFECFEQRPTAISEMRRVAKSATAPEKTRTLARIIEAEIIPRLMLASRPETAEPPNVAARLDVDDDDIADFAEMMIRLDVGKAQNIVAEALARGVGIDAVMLDVLSPTAQMLGRMWVDDTCTFTDVTVGLCTLQSLLRSLETNYEIAPAPAVNAGSGLFAALPGEQHTFGVLMLETFFRRAGWDVVGMPLAASSDIVSSVSRRSFTLVGLSLSRESELETMKELIRLVRKKSCNPALTVMVGGRVFQDAPELVAEVGADMTAIDGREAVVASQHLLWSTRQTH